MRLGRGSGVQFDTCIACPAHAPRPLEWRKPGHQEIPRRRRPLDRGWNAQPFQRDSRITLQKLPRWNCGSLSASTSAFTLPNVVSGLCLMPS